MAQFDVSFLNPKMKRGTGSGGYNFLVDQLAIKENQLATDGKLTPGDFDVLANMAQSIYANPNLTADQRSNVAVKLSEYKQKKANTAQKDTSDIDRINRDVKDDFNAGTMLLGNNPAALVKQRADVLHSKLSSLKDTIDNLQNSGDDASSHLNEFSSTLAEYNDILDAYDGVKNYQAGSGQPAANMVAYITTNSRGEITGVDMGRPGAKTGYLETNGLYGGLQVYGKVNKKDNGKNIFLLGKESFSAPDVMVPDPQNPLAMKASTLVADSMKSGDKISTSQSGQYKDVDPAQLVTQTALRPNSWARGEKGFLYQRGEDGKYKKYVNADPAKLGISDNEIISLPRSMEANMVPFVSETVDGSQPFNPPASLTSPIGPLYMNPANQNKPPAQQTLAPAATERTTSPIARAASTAKNIAGAALGAAKNFLGSLFSE
jgi:hypothetical protein